MKRHIICHECPHDIDHHYGDGGCLAGWDKEGENLCGCDLHPSDIALPLLEGWQAEAKAYLVRAVKAEDALKAEPTEAEVEAAARAIAALLTEETAELEADGQTDLARQMEARAALRAAAEARR